MGCGPPIVSLVNVGGAMCHTSHSAAFLPLRPDALLTPAPAGRPALGAECASSGILAS